MASFPWARRLRSLFRPQAQTPRRLSHRPQLEALEVREAPAAHTWTGLAGDGSWKNSVNWIGGAPTEKLADLTFPSTATTFTTTNDLPLVGGLPPTINSITFSGKGYTLGGSQITLGDPLTVGSGTISVNQNLTGETINLDIGMGGSPGGRQTFTVNNGSDLTIGGHLSGTTGSNLTKEGTGKLTLSNDNSAFTGPITLDNGSGIVVITNAKALGSTSAPTAINQNAQLQVSNVTGPINEPLFINGSGIANDGALLNAAGNNTWAGTIEMFSDTTFGAAAGSLNITGQISDNVAHNVIKEGVGQVIFSAADTYRGTTTVNNGILTVRNATALGAADGTSATAVTVNESTNSGGTIIKSGTLQLEDPTGKGFTVVNKLLTLNGVGFVPVAAGIGALDNLKGNNGWTGNVILASPLPNGHDVTISAESGDPLYSLTLSGVVKDPNGDPKDQVFELTKIGAGALVLTNNNTYLGATDVRVGTLEIRDSHALGNNPTDATPGAGTTVETGATLKLAVDNIPDSVTGTTNTLRIAEPVTINGTGVANAGALFSASGINTYTAKITLGNALGVTQDAIGVAPDPNPTNNKNYFTNDYSLTVIGDIAGPKGITLDKVDPGHLILPTANDYLGPTNIKAGWVTIEDPGAVGAVVPGVGDSLQPAVTVQSGAALHLDPSSGSMNLAKNLILSGDGMDHPDPLINHQGALENIAGINTASGFITLQSQVGIGVEKVFGTASQLTLTGEVLENASPVISTGATASGGSAEDDNIIDTGSTSGTVTVNYNMYYVPDSLDIYYGVFGQGGVKIGSTNGQVAGSGTISVPYGPGSSTDVEIIVNQGGGQSGTAWTYSVNITPKGSSVGGLTKLGSQLLILEDNGIFGGAVDIKQGVVLDQSPTALGRGLSEGGTSTITSPSTTTVEAGAALLLGTTLPATGLPTGVVGQFDGGLQAGFGTWGEHLILNGPGNTTLGTPLAPLTVLNSTVVNGVSLTAPNTDVITAGDFLWQGPVTLNTTVPIDVQPNTRLTIAGAIDDAGNTSSSGSDLITMDTGELVLSGSNTYRGTTYVGTSTTADPVIPEAQTVTITGSSGTFTLSFNGSAPTPALAFNAPALDVQSALNALATVGGADGFVSVSLTGKVYTIIFGGTLAGPTQTPLVAAGSAAPVVGAVTNVNEFFGSGAPAPALPGGILTVENDQALGGTAINEVQTVKVTGTSGTFTLSFNGSAPTSALPFNDTALDVQSALNALSTIGGVGGSVTVTLKNSTYTITFGGTLAGFNQPLLVAGGSAATTVKSVTDGAGGTIVQNGAQLQLAGSITISSEPLMVQGSGVSTANTPAVPSTWFSIGPAPINKGGTAGNQPSTGRVTGVATDPTDPNIIYIATAGGGAWRTVDGGRTWLPLFDAPGVLFGGAIAVAPSDPHTIYFGTGEADNSGDTYYGTGVYKSTDSGRSWTLLVDNTPGATPNPLFGQAISRIVVDPMNPNLIYLSSSSDPADGFPINEPAPAGKPGIWRYDGTKWFDLTAVTSVVRAGGPRTPGPDDDFRLAFPQKNATWSDLALSSTGTLYAALGTAFGDPNNAVYRTANPTSNAPIWDVGDGAANSKSSKEYPTNIATPADRNSTIKITVFGLTIYAANTDPVTGGLLDIQKSTDGGVTWAAVTKEPLNYLGDQGDYDSTILTTNGSTVYVGGQEADPATHLQHVFVTTDGGGTWTDISIDGKKNGPHTDDHALAVDEMGRIIIGNDGGVWRYDPTAPATPTTGTWTDINGNLATITFNGVATDPTDPNHILGGSQDNGTELFTGAQEWTMVDGGDGGLVRIDPQNPLLAYHVVNGFLVGSTDGGKTWPNILINAAGQYFPFLIDPINTSRLLVGGDSLQESLDQGATFTDLMPPIAVQAVAAAVYQGPFDNTGFSQITDKGASSYDPDTIYVTDGTSVYVTKNHGATWANRTSNLPATNANGYGFYDIEVDPKNEDIAYLVNSDPVNAGNGRVFMTSNAGVTWTDITGNLPDIPTWKLVLDPRNGNLYVGNDDGVYTSAGGGLWSRLGILPHVEVLDLDLNLNFNTLTAGTYGRSAFQLSLDIPTANSGALRALSGTPVWNGPILLTGDTTIQTDGNQNLPSGVSAAQFTIVGTISDLIPGGNHAITKTGGGSLILSGANTYGGVTDIQQGVLTVDNPNALGASGSGQGTTVESGATLELQSNLNAEPVALNGQGATQLNGHDTGALRNFSGNNIYNGTLTLSSSVVTIGVDTGSTLTIGTIPGSSGTGTITDGGAKNNLVKELTGTLVYADANSYGGGTFTVPSEPIPAPTLTGGTAVVQGVLNVQNAGALSGFSGGATTTTVFDGAQLQIQGGVTTLANQSLRLSGSGIFGTGALLSVGGANKWEGPVTFAQDAAFLPSSFPPANVTIGVLDTGAGDGLTIDGAVGQLSGLTLGLNKVGAGRLILTNVNSYGGTTDVIAGALRIQNGGALGTAGNPPTNGTTVESGAVLEVDGDPAGTGAGINITSEALTLNGTGLAATNAGALDSVSGSNSWTGPVFLQTADSIGADGTSRLTISGTVQDAPEEQTITVVPATGGGGRFTLTFNGQTTSPALFDTATAMQVQTALNALTSIGGVGGSVSVTEAATPGGVTPAGNIYTIIFGGTLASQNLPAIVAVGSSGATAAAATLRDGPVPAPSLTKVGTGTLIFPAANTYNGPTLVNAGILLIQAGTSVLTGGLVASPLGGVFSEIQSFTLSGPLTGSFTLTFNNKQTGSLSANYNNATFLTDVKNALNGLSTIGGVGGSVSVAFSPPGTPGTTFTVTFGGSLAGADQTQITAIGSGGTGVDVSTVQDGSSGTVVASGATLQVQGGVSVSSETLTLNGQGVNGGGALQNVTGNNTWATPITLGSNAALGAGIAEVQMLNVTATSGTFTLKFNGSAASTALDVTSSTLAADIQKALNALSTISGVGGVVTVTQSGNLFTVVFAGTLQGLNQPQLVAAGSAVPVVSTVVDGAGAGNTLIVNQPIGDGGSGFGVTKVGAGTLDYAGGAGTGNTYTGLTQVNQGTLLLDKSGGASALNGNLMVGDGLPGAATALWVFSNQVPDTATVTVNSDGTADLNAKTETIGPLVINDGVVRTGTGGKLTITTLTMTGGKLTAGTDGATPTAGQVILGGDVTATSSATQTAVIDGGTTTSPGTLSLGGAARTFTVNAGAQAIDLDVVAQIIPGSGTPGLTKKGGGVMQIDAANTSTGYGATTLTAGTLQVDGTIGNVLLNGSTAAAATLGGAGTVGNVSTLGSNGGTVNPGDGPGTLNAASVSLNAGSAFAVDLTNTTGNSLLNVTGTGAGNVSLNGATIIGVVDPAIIVGHAPFTVIETAGTLDATQFVQGGSAFINGRKFNITYNGSAVLLTPVLMDDTLALTSSVPTTSVYGQGVTFTATVTPETGGGPVPDGDFVEFTFDGGAPVDVATSGGVATFTPTATKLTVTAGGSPHTVTAKFLGDGNYNPSAQQSLTQAVNKATSQFVITQDSPTVVFGQNVVVTVTISAVSPGTGNPTAPTGQVTFTVDGGNPAGSPATLNVGGVAGNLTGVASITLSGLSVNPHRIRISYPGDGNFLAVSSTSDYTLTVAKADTNVVVAGPASAPTYGQSATFNATLSAKSPGSGEPADGELVTFLDGTSAIGNGVLAGGVAMLTVSNLSAGTHTITAQFLGDGNFNSGSGSLTGFTVNKATTNVGLSSSANPSSFGQSVVVTAAVTATSAGNPTPVGSVTFVVDGSTKAPVAVDGAGHASITLPSLGLGSHTITATFAGNSNFGDSGPATLTQVVNAGTTTALTAAPNPSQLGQAVSFLATVTATNAGAGTPTGSVTFAIDGTPMATPGLDGSGKASFAISTLGLGAHTVTATYNPTGNFGVSGPTALTQNVQAATTVAIAPSVNPSVYGQPVTYTATVTAPNAAAGTPTGSVTFAIDGAVQGSVGLDANGQAAFTPGPLGVGGHSITATYNATANFTGSGPVGVAETVNAATASTSLSSSTPILGQSITYVATVTPVAPSTAVPTGTVTFVIDGVVRGTVALDANGQASLTVSGLTRGDHTVATIFNGGAGFVPGGPSAPIDTPLISNFTGTPTDVFINEVYLDLLNRPVDPANLSFWDNQIETGSISRTQMVLAILNGQEYQTDYVTNLYNNILHRAPLLTDIQIHLGILAGGATLEQETANFLGSNESILRNGLEDPFVYTNFVFQYALGHSASLDAQLWGVAYLQTHTTVDLALQVLSSPEYQGDFVTNAYASLLGHGVPASTAPNPWFMALQGGATDQQVLAGIAGSQEYFSRLRPYQQVAGLQSWLNHAFIDLLGRPIDPQALALYTGAMEDGASRDAVTRSFVSSPEYRTRVLNTIYENLLNRPIDPASLSLRLGQLAAGATVEGIKADVMGSAEYYFGHGGGTAFGFLNAVYLDSIGLPVDPVGLSIFGTELAAGLPRDQVALGVLETPNALGGEVAQAYLATLRRSTDIPGVLYYAGQVQLGLRSEILLADLVATPEYYFKFANG